MSTQRLTCGCLQERYSQQPKSESNQNVYKLTDISIMEYNSAIKKNELVIQTATWMTVKIIILNERRQITRVHTAVLHLYKL